MQRDLIIKHHPLNGKFLQFPIKCEKKQMFQLFCHIRFMNTLPAYYLTALQKVLTKNHLENLIKFLKIKKVKKLMKKNEK